MAFYSSTKSSVHQNYVTQNDRTPLASIQSFHFPREAQHSLATLKLYSAKAEYTTTFQCQLELYFSITPHDSIQSKFLMPIFQVVCWVPNVVLKREARLSRVETRPLTCIIAGYDQYGSGQSYKNFNILAFPGRWDS